MNNYIIIFFIIFLIVIIIKNIGINYYFDNIDESSFKKLNWEENIYTTHILITRFREEDISKILRPIVNKKNVKIFIYNKGKDIPSGIPNDANNIAGHAFLVFGCFSTAFAIIAAYTLSNIAIHLSSFDTKQMEVAFATKMQPLVYFAHACYLFSFFSLVASITLMAHGCNYAAYGGVNMIIGTSSLAFLLCVCYWTYTCFWKAFALKTPTKQQISVAKRDAYQQWLEQQQQDVSRILAQVANIGSQATLASGFSYYQIVTFQTDVLTLPWLNTHLATLFLFASVICVTAGEGFVCALLMYIE